MVLDCLTEELERQGRGDIQPEGARSAATDTPVSRDGHPVGHSGRGGHAVLVLARSVDWVGTAREGGTAEFVGGPRKEVGPAQGYPRGVESDLGDRARTHLGHTDVEYRACDHAEVEHRLAISAGCAAPGEIAPQAVTLGIGFTVRLRGALWV